MPVAQFADLPTIEFDEVSAENRRYVLLNIMPERSSMVAVDAVTAAVNYIVNTMDLKVLIYYEKQFDWLHARVEGSSGTLTKIFYEVWLAVTESDCIMLTLKYPRIVQAIITPE